MHFCMADVTLFHEVMDLPILNTPQIPEPDRVKLRMRLIEEECKETLEAMARGDLPETADGFADLVYVVAGAALEYGIDLEQVWDEVQRSNMAKVDPHTNKVKKDEGGKVLKPDGWTPPDIAGVLRKQGWDG